MECKYIISKMEIRVSSTWPSMALPSSKSLNPNDPLGMFIYTKSVWGEAPLRGGLLPSKISKSVDLVPLDPLMHLSTSTVNGSQARDECRFVILGITLSQRGVNARDKPPTFTLVASNVPLHRKCTQKIISSLHINHIRPRSMTSTL